MRGRRPAGPDYVDHLDGSATAKERLKVVLETIAGTRRVQEACQLLGICEQRFHQLREGALTAALKGLEPGSPGRPPHTPAPAADQVRVLQEQLEDKDVALQAAKVREEIALTLPRVVKAPGGTTTEKKTRGRLRQTRARPPGMRKNT